ncbi:MAG: copper chaperone PCu(A)C [Pseudomonadales bacterium]
MKFVSLGLALLLWTVLGALTGLGGCSPAPEQPVVEQGRFKEPLPGKSVVAGYFELHNPTASPWLLQSVSADTGTSVEIHRTVRNGDQVRMQRIKSLPLAPGERVSFTPGSYHLMLFGVESTPAQTRVTLHFDGDRRVTATFGSEPW